MEAKKVLFISQEVSPYVPDTEMSVLGKEVPQSVHSKEFEVRIFTPKYSCINERRNQLHEVIRLSGMNLVIDDNDHPLIIKVATLLPSRMQVYFIDNDDYFMPLPEKGLEIDVLRDDNDERLMFFTTGVVETVKKLRWPPAIVQCNGWIAALAPMVIRARYADDPTFRDSKIIVSLQKDGFEGTLDPRFAEKMVMNEFDADDVAAIKEPVDYLTLMKFAIDNADGVMQLSEGVDDELLAYAAASGKPMLSLVGEDDRKAAMTEYYRSLLGED